MAGRKIMSLIAASSLAVAVLQAGPAASQEPVPEPSPSTSPTPEPTPTEEPASIFLEASRTAVTYGTSVKLTGSISSQASGETVVFQAGGNKIDQTQTIENGRFVLEVQPKENMSLVARWGDVSSDPVQIKVHAVVTAHIGEVKLFDKTVVAGRVQPPNGKVSVKLHRNGKTAAKRSVKVKNGRFSTNFYIDKPGKYNATVKFKDGKHVSDSAKTKSGKTKLPTLSLGSQGVYVKLLEKRLVKLNYFLTGVNNHYDSRTSDAILAFNKVNGRARVGSSIDAATWKALASPYRPKPKSGMSAHHIEVDQSRQVFYSVKNGKIKAIVHVSTGAGSATRDGSFKIYKKGGAGAGYFPSYFDGARAFHAWDDVPPTNASHGCIRLPWWAARWYWKQTPIGTPVVVYH